MELQFEAPLHQRFHRYGMSVTVWETADQEGLWWDRTDKKWVLTSERNFANGCSSHCSPVRTLKAFKRHLRKHAESLKGYRVIWVNRFVGYDVEVVL